MLKDMKVKMAIGNLRVLLFCPTWARGLWCSLTHCWFWRYINHLFAYLTFLLTFFLTYLLPYLSTSSRIGPFHFQPVYYYSITHNFAKCWRIFEIQSLSDTAVNVRCCWPNCIISDHNANFVGEMAVRCLQSCDINRYLVLVS